MTPYFSRSDKKQRSYDKICRKIGENYVGLKIPSTEASNGAYTNLVKTWLFFIGS